MSLADPRWLFLLALVPLLGIVAMVTARLRSRRWQAFVANRLRPALLKKTEAFGHWLSLLFLLVSLALLIGALAKPQGDAGTRSETVKGRNILFALDLSRSMRVDDVKPDRLSQGKAIIYEMMEAMPNDRMGLVGFAGTPYLFAPLTVDHGAVKETVDQIDETWIPTGGSNVVEALKFSIEALKKTGVHNNALVFISDGEKHDGSLDDVLDEATKAGVYIFTVGVGTESGAEVPDPGMPGGRFHDRQGRTVLSQMQPEVLRKIAEGTKGRFVVAGTGVDIPALAQSALSDIDQFELQGREKKVTVEFYQWLVGPAIISLLISILFATRWRPIATRTAVAATMAGTVSTSGAASPQEARLAVGNGHFEEARNGYHDLAEGSKRKEDSYRYRLAEGEAAYKGAEFRKAAEAYSGALMSDNADVARNAHLGAGASLFHLGWQSLGNETYPDPAPEDTEAFDALVKAKLKELAEKEVPEAGDTESYTFFNSLIVNWTDAIRHYNSALKLLPSDKDAAQNRALTVRYLERLEELLKEQQQESQQQIPQEMGQGPGQPEGEDGDGEGDGQPGDKGEGGDKKGNGSNGDEKGKGKGGDEKDKDKGKNGKDEKRPGETPQERAKRLLGENEDLQKGPTAQGNRRNHLGPEKDW
ncbi:VWA domain-containing protein [Luteolibacter ambystomatis]|uniref:VWA domain-containing protein n=1 Tax=Luteolibacter ambystomatis TaxID=2824561 RepID=A0A975PEX1_9BACT|nr:VWA domain-containing protein [Luteolibacter ambystomatis]QUE51699.1 VWA domain-containing protein [Luteolibacter ambystomatis]